MKRWAAFAVIFKYCSGTVLPSTANRVKQCLLLSTPSPRAASHYSRPKEAFKRHFVQGTKKETGEARWITVLPMTLKK